ncbi:MAG: leucine-rich repeat protein, partial [Firmicutes bacterium]|nr:leucine-rich repeat protein [Candidatus Caballimonas caccae]
FSACDNDIHEHNFIEQVVLPTCTEQGYTIHKCSCGEEYIDNEIAAKGHQIITHNANQPTCLNVGWDSYFSCEFCEYSTYVELPALGHNYHNGICQNCSDVKKYIVTWLDYDNTILETDEVIYGTSPKYNGATPYREKTVYQTFLFEGWDKELSPVIDDVIFKAMYSIKDTLFTIKFNGNGGELIDGAEEVIGKYRQNIAIPTYTRPGYTFDGWKGTNGEKLSATSKSLLIVREMIYEAQWIPIFIVKEGVICGFAKKSSSYYVLPDTVSNVVEIPSMIDGVEIISIGASAFSSCCEVTRFILPDTIKTIGVMAFWDCINLRSIKLGGGVETIKHYAFWDCVRLDSITIPKSVKKIEYNAFQGCAKLSSVFFNDKEHWEKAVYKNDGSGTYSKIEKIDVSSYSIMAQELKNSNLTDYIKKEE